MVYRVEHLRPFRDVGAVRATRIPDDVENLRDMECTPLTSWILGVHGRPNARAEHH
jgi:hypothetical protein